MEREKIELENEQKGGCPVMSSAVRINRVSKRFANKEEKPDHHSSQNMLDKDAEQKCPFLRKQKLASESSSGGEPTLGTTQQPIQKAGKCPIPYHHEISQLLTTMKTPGFWVKVSIFCFAVWVARKL